MLHFSERADHLVLSENAQVLKKLGGVLSKVVKLTIAAPAGVGIVRADVIV